MAPAGVCAGEDRLGTWLFSTARRFIRRLLRRAALFLWIIPFSAALSRALIARRVASAAFRLCCLFDGQAGFLNERAGAPGVNTVAQAALLVLLIALDLGLNICQLTPPKPFLLSPCAAYPESCTKRMITCMICNICGCVTPHLSQGKPSGSRLAILLEAGGFVQHLEGPFAAQYHANRAQEDINI